MSKVSVLKHLLVSCLVLLTLINYAQASSVAEYLLPDGEVLKDPTRPEGWQAERKAAKKRINFQLNYILNADIRKQAIVNKQKVGVGDFVDGAKVLQITKDSVTIVSEGKTRVLHVNSRHSIKRAQ